MWSAAIVVAMGGATSVPSSGGGVTPKDEAEAVMNAGMPFAQKMLTEHGEFYPFGFAMNTDGTVVAVAGTSPNEHPPSQQVIDNLAAAFRAGASKGQYKVTAVFFDVRVQQPGNSDKTDAVQVGVEHVSGYCADVFFPYSRNANGGVTYGGVFAAKREGVVFGTCN
jgi:hypothetical protein